VHGGHDKNEGTTMRLGGLAKQRRKEYSQMTLIECDGQLQRHWETIEDTIFDRESRNSSLGNGEFGPPSGTLFEAIYKELKHREERKEKSGLFSKMLSGLHESRAKKKLIGIE
jgi:hypothetical protein